MDTRKYESITNDAYSTVELNVCEENKPFVTTSEVICSFLHLEYFFFKEF